jgi:hypothetical protein
MNETDLFSRARVAYELGRLRGSLRVAPYVVAMAAVAFACGRPLPLIAGLGGLLLALAVALSFVGGVAGRAVVPGLLAGAVALAPPLLLHVVGHACIGPSCMTLGLPTCIAGGALGGMLIARRATGEALPFVLAATTVAAVTGTFGCSVAGAAGVLGMLAGTVGAGAPLLLAARR